MNESRRMAEYHDDDEEDHDEAEWRPYHKPGTKEGHVWDETTDEFVSCSMANCQHCTRFQLDLCAGYDDEKEGGDADWTIENDKQDMKEAEFTNEPHEPE